MTAIRGKGNFQEKCFFLKKTIARKKQVLFAGNRKP